MLLRKCDICGNEIQPFAIESENDSDNGFFRLMLYDYTKFDSEKGYYADSRYLDICPDCLLDAMDGSNGSLILRKLVGPEYDWNTRGLIVGK